MDDVSKLMADLLAEGKSLEEAVRAIAEFKGNGGQIEIRRQMGRFPARLPHLPRIPGGA